LSATGYELVAHDECSPDGGVSGAPSARRRLIAPRPSSGLWLDVATLEAGGELTLGSDRECHELVYVLSGTVELTGGSEEASIEADTAFLHDAPTPATVRAQSPARLAVFGADEGCDDHAPMGERVVCTRLDLGRSDAATGARSFQILLGPENGCRRATMFVGVVPPGAAPWHFHQYDEIVYLLEGSGSYHQADGVQSTGPGSAVRIPPRTVHINENTGSADMLVLGVFTPAGSPSAAYLANDPRPR
jgi:mannose-6-phosphate isomerase-like protein (cupin superfamily)